MIVRSEPGDDLDPSLVHCLEALSLLLRILVRNGADEVGAPALAVLDPRLGRVPLDDDLATSISVSARRSTADRSSTQCVAAGDVFHSLLRASRDCARCGLGCLSRALLTMLRGYPESAVQSSTVNKLSLDRTIGLFIGFLRRSDGLSAVAGGQCGRRGFPQPARSHL